MNFLEKIIELIASEFDCASVRELSTRLNRLESQVAELMHARQHHHHHRGGFMVITIGMPVQK